MSQSVHGGTGNVVTLVTGNGSTVNNISTPKHVTRTIAKVEPGVKHITDSQRVVLQGLVDDIVELEKKVRKSPKGYQSVWRSLNSHCHASQYMLITIENYDKAEKYLRQWIGRLNSSASASVADNDTWRKRRYAYIKINTSTKSDEEWLLVYLQKNFNVASLADISDDDLEKIYRMVVSRKSRLRLELTSQSGKDSQEQQQE